VPTPSYPIHLVAPRLPGGTVVTAPVSEGIDGVVEAAAASRARVVVVSYPHNPTTATVTEEELQRLVDAAREHEVLVVHDFASADSACDGHRPASVLAADGALECAVELYSLTKSFSMAGWRVGFLLGRPDVVQALAKLKSYLDYGTFQPIQIASIVALREAQDTPEAICAQYLSRRDALCGGRPRGRLAGLAAARDDVPLGADPRTAPAARLARVLAPARSVGARGGQPGDRLRRWRGRPRPLRPGGERAANRPGDAGDQEAAGDLTG